MNIVVSVAAATIVVLALLLQWYLRSRQRSALAQVTHQLHRIAVGGSLRGRIELDDDRPELASLVTVVNHLRPRAGHSEPDSHPAAAAPVSALGDQLHEVVLIHGARGILYANPQFASLVGTQ